ncbi:hypothetical protein KL930_002171 [Ogataea haglerorum]|uniref:Uncharacterized protein n=1 Tax=Ogataea haglerorum TaxID=1937702 RepID=A0AAN6D7V0_9ASCO|nr:hypothetical protein KL950_001101 [Ogataea haglerorum]KAG7720433.1 hypothetical protein KL913_001333 [Ogataea haglerorum]KAG7720819.1 hypothetical protein KL949_001691 [Ogataea haglerorum]KAG7728587.1 hypothetical protein KL933_001820 [Ogataea haglerorum]KAG7733900.1 hypothetical protein KL948_001102 [Ogataea haglerorum]
MKENVFEDNVAQLAHCVGRKCANVRTERVDGKVHKLVTRDSSLKVYRRVDPAITLVDHPVLGKPFYQLHPCQTAQLLEDVALQGPASLEFWWKFYSSVLM